MPRYSRLRDDITCDVVVVGGGITGAMIAFHLTKMGLNVVLLDAEDVGEGSTAANTGLLLYELDKPLHKLAAQIGKEAAIRAYRASYDALQAFPGLVAGLNDSCGLTSRHSIYLASTAADVDDLLSEADARRSIGIDVVFLSSDQIRGRFLFDMPGALESSLAMEVDPYRLTHALVRAAQSGGARIFSHTKIAQSEPDEHGATLHCDSGCRVRAGKVVFATGYESQISRSPISKRRGTFVAVSQPLGIVDGWEPRSLIWETARPYFYLRSTEDGRAMIGGEDVDGAMQITAQDVEQKAFRLVHRFNKLFPSTKFQVAFSWGGVFADTTDGLPFIGTHPQKPNVLFALCYGGNGTTFSLIAADTISGIYKGNKPAELDLFRLDR